MNNIIVNIDCVKLSLTDVYCIVMGWKINLLSGDKVEVNKKFTAVERKKYFINDIFLSLFSICICLWRGFIEAFLKFFTINTTRE